MKGYVTRKFHLLNKVFHKLWDRIGMQIEMNIRKILKRYLNIFKKHEKFDHNKAENRISFEINQEKMWILFLFFIE